MCNIKEGFKLCTCAKELSRKEADWLLYKIKPLNERSLTIGLVSFNFHNKEEQAQQVLIKEELNNRNCFDFEYHPNEKDILVIKDKDKEGKFIFEFDQGEWYSKPAESLEHLIVNSGKIESKT